ncbi:MAG TPA: response regulator [Chitinophagaceae bacterium]
MKVVDILMVEDDYLDTLDIKRTLDKMGLQYHMQVATNGEEAIGQLEVRGEQGGKLPDVVLIDINMPKMNGLELLSVIRGREDWKALKCFVVTTSEERVDRDKARQLGVSGYIVKPFKINNPSSIDSFNLMIDLMNM